ncbi:hypothetical protein KZ829_27170 [Actinoplanes hulinensis]|uniref:Uncharacterized protein n=1 Tax=Actinoplanes hulinensis TaxID=1144547 RepID=A0ABS7B9V9_9ACTN|nr:hypothetical protein [Actinoplanes hulinensis]MBW6437421.1 hypothetical protein [Actinoplanes hulinensis]
MLLTGLCLVTADRLARSTPAQVLAVLAVGAALIGVIAAVAGQLWVTLPSRSLDGAGSQRTRRGARLIMAAGTLSMVAVVLAAVATLLVVLRTEQKTMAAPAAPTVALQLTRAAGPMALSVQLSVPGLPAGSVVDTKLFAEGQEDPDEYGQPQTSRVLLARSVVPADRDGLSVAQLAATVENYHNVVIEAETPDRRCEQTLSLDDVDAAAPPLTCTPT